jgi:hypothetical protein
MRSFGVYKFLERPLYANGGEIKEHIFIVRKGNRVVSADFDALANMAQSTPPGGASRPSFTLTANRRAVAGNNGMVGEHDLLQGPENSGS